MKKKNVIRKLDLVTLKDPGFRFDRKKQQRIMNSWVRAMNRSIEEDNLWRGRFVIRQKSAERYILEDEPDKAELWVELVFIDKKTGKTFGDRRPAWAWCRWNGMEIWDRMNQFIIGIVDVWNESDVQDGTIDWTKAKLPKY